MACGEHLPEEILQSKLGMKSRDMEEVSVLVCVRGFMKRCLHVS